jgi:hypothetical protein
LKDGNKLVKGVPVGLISQTLNTLECHKNKYAKDCEIYAVPKIVGHNEATCSEDY